LSKRVIKKYPNRRLYDTQVSQYVTLDDIRELVVAGDEIQVLDAKTQQDITRSILLQIIVEQEEAGDPILSANVLSRIIRFYGDAMQNFMVTYLERSMDSFLEQQEKMRKQFTAMMEQTPLNVMGNLTERNMELWQSMQDAFLRSTGVSGNSSRSKLPEKTPSTSDAEGKD